MPEFACGLFILTVWGSFVFVVVRSREAWAEGKHDVAYTCDCDRCLAPWQAGEIVVRHACELVAKAEGRAP